MSLVIGGMLLAYPVAIAVEAAAEDRRNARAEDAHQSLRDARMERIRAAVQWAEARTPKAWVTS